MTFPFSINTQIPAANNDPAADQPLMMINYANIAGFLAVDHVAAGTNNGGRGAAFHKQVTYYKKNPTDFVPAAAPPDPTLFAFTAQSNNTAFFGLVSAPAITVQQPFYWSANAVYPSSPVKAFGLLQLTAGSPATPAILNGWNLDLLSTADGKNFSITLPRPNIVQGQNIAVFFSSGTTTGASNPITVISWSFTNPTLTFVLSNTVGSSGVPLTVLISLAIMQV